MNAISGFKLDLKDISFFSAGLERPESVLATKCGDVYTSNGRGGISHIRPNGSQSLILGTQTEARDFISNGFCLMPDGSFLIANIGPDGGVWKLTRDGRLTLWLMEVDGVRFGQPNFVLRDDQGRIWINGLRRKLQGSYSPGMNEGFFVLVDERGPRIVADGVDVPNELRIDPVRKFVYTNETFMGRLIRFDLGDDGSMTNRQTVAQFDRTDHLDGLALDEDGNIWVASVIVNRLYRITPSGEKTLLIENSDPEWTERAALASESGTFTRAILYEEHGLTLKNISSVTFGGPDLRTVYLGCLCGDRLATFRAPIAGMKPSHWDFGPF